MKVVLLAGGRGTRIAEESIVRPKPMVEIGGKPILWHIMKGYSYYGFYDFIICAGYKQEYIKEWFNNYFLYSSDVTFDYTERDKRLIINRQHIEPWRVTIVDTGLDTMTGGRIKQIQDFIQDEPFMLTYGDAVCDVNIAHLYNFHKNHGKLVTVTSVIKSQEKGVLDINEIGAVRAFREKQDSDGTPINAGYMVLQPQVFEYLKDDSTVLETTVLNRLAEEGQLMSYKHTGFWQCMDSLREKEMLELYWSKDNAPWRIW